MSTRRAYRSALRQERAVETRARILASARELLTNRGFTRVTIEEVAQVAGVSTQTVYAVFGGKGGMLRALLAEMEERAGLPALVHRLEEEDDARVQLRTFVGWIRTLYDQEAPILRAASAAASDADVASMMAEGDTKRKHATARLASVWHDQRSLRQGLARKDAAEQLWLLTSVELFLFATERLNWSAARYERWLRELLERELFHR